MARVPSAWLTTPWLRSWQAIGGPWGVLGVSQWQHPAILALAALGGVWLVTFALAVANTGLAVAILAPAVSEQFARQIARLGRGAAAAQA